MNVNFSFLRRIVRAAGTALAGAHTHRNCEQRSGCTRSSPCVVVHRAGFDAVRKRRGRRRLSACTAEVAGRAPQRTDALSVDGFRDDRVCTRWRAHTRTGAPRRHGHSRRLALDHRRGWACIRPRFTRASRSTAPARSPARRVPRFARAIRARRAHGVRAERNEVFAKAARAKAGSR
jgi:hypothetical protein